MLLYFWKDSAYENNAADLYAKYKNRGLVVLGVHPEADSDQLDVLVKEKQIEFPIAIDKTRHETELKYFVKVWPTYVLINRNRTVRQGYQENPPTEAQIEEALK